MAELELIELQNEVADRLRGDSYFSDIQVFTNAEPDFGALITKALTPLTGAGGKAGACVMVDLPFANDANANALNGPLDMIINLIVLEHILYNRATTDGGTGTGKHARSIARRIHRVCKLFQPQGISTAWECQKPFITDVSAQVAEVLGDPSFQALSVSFGCRESVYTGETKLSPPTIGVADGLVTITSPDSGVTIYYTIDGTHPRPATATYGSSAEAYTIPFAAPEGSLRIRACAFKTGYIASDVTQYTS